MNRVWAKRVGWSVSAALGWWALTRLLPRRSPLADKAALRYMRPQRQGRIANVTSIGWPGRA
ncbi:MAG TPA: hypothetical protein VLT58_18805 [Polyangia bacterium]|nr:hypothetical protein [Polyangia bacterium]